MLLRRWYTKPYLGVPINWEHDLAQGLVGCWLFNEDGGGKVYDAVNYPHGNNGTLTNMDPKTDWVPGKFGKALDFDGNDDYVIATLDGTSLTTLSVEMWIKQSSVSTDSIFQWANQLNAASPFILFSDYSGSFWLFVDGGYRITTPISQNTWHYIVTTYDGTDWKLYKDGSLVDSYTGGYGAQQNAVNVYLGNGYQGYWNGLIDNVSIFNRALTAQEIQQLYYEPFAMFEYPSVARYYVAPAVGVTVGRLVNGGLVNTGLIGGRLAA